MGSGTTQQASVDQRLRRVARRIAAAASSAGPLGAAGMVEYFDYSFDFASGGASTLVVPMSLISIVVVRSTSRSSPLMVIVPLTLYWNFVSTPSALTQNFAVPLALAIVGAFALAAAPR